MTRREKTSYLHGSNDWHRARIYKKTHVLFEQLINKFLEIPLATFPVKLNFEKIAAEEGIDDGDATFEISISENGIYGNRISDLHYREKSIWK